MIMVKCNHCGHDWVQAGSEPTDVLRANCPACDSLGTFNAEICQDPMIEDVLRDGFDSQGYRPHAIVGTMEVQSDDSTPRFAVIARTVDNRDLCIAMCEFPHPCGSVFGFTAAFLPLDPGVPWQPVIVNGNLRDLLTSMFLNVQPIRDWQAFAAAAVSGAA